MDIKQIRQRIMCEAYDLADRGDHEGYNAVKVMCSDVLELIGKQWVGLTDEELKPLCDENHIMLGAYTVDFIQAVEAKLKEKNHG